MRNHVVPAIASSRPLRQTDATGWVCLALGLSVLVLALRIVSVW